jgi:hypothetical protein
VQFSGGLERVIHPCCDKPVHLQHVKRLSGGHLFWCLICCTEEGSKTDSSNFNETTHRVFLPCLAV